MTSAAAGQLNAGVQNVPNYSADVVPRQRGPARRAPQDRLRRDRRVRRQRRRPRRRPSSLAMPSRVLDPMTPASSRLARVSRVLSFFDAPQLPRSGLHPAPAARRGRNAHARSTSSRPPRRRRRRVPSSGARCVLGRLARRAAPSCRSASRHASAPARRPNPRARAADRALDDAWGALQSWLLGWTRLPDHAHPLDHRRARALRRALPEGPPVPDPRLQGRVERIAAATRPHHRRAASTTCIHQARWQAVPRERSRAATAPTAERRCNITAPRDRRPIRPMLRTADGAALARRDASCASREYVAHVAATVRRTPRAGQSPWRRSCSRPLLIALRGPMSTLYDRPRGRDARERADLTSWRACGIERPLHAARRPRRAAYSLDDGIR